VPPPSPPGTPGVDSADARDLRAALEGFHALVSVRVAPQPVPPALDLRAVHAAVLKQVEPVRAFPQRIGAIARVGGHDFGRYIGTYADSGDYAAGERIVPAMAYPDIKRPMYEPLRDLSSDLFVPNLNLVEPNTISLMVRNQPFIEAYMVGLNHEFARELLWREYPTDQRPSTFRQFWDVAHAANVDNLDPKAFEESLRDIRRLHEWGASSRLGDHNHRHKPGDPPETADTPLEKRAVALVIRGDLLKRYPNTIIYAQRARWGTRPQDSLRLVLWDETGERSEADAADPNIRYPLYRASVGPDIHFIGFDLSVEEVRGDKNLDESAAAKASIPANKLGWFFAIKQAAGEPRFGLDEHPPAAGEAGERKWVNLSWDNLGEDVRLIDLDKPFAVPPLGSSSAGVEWGANAADMASILYQKPVLVAVHAREMLRSVT
jgi:hypothetical protein